MVTTSDERVAQALAAQLRTMEQDRMSGQNQSKVDLLLGSLNYRIEQLAIQIGRLGI